MARPHADVAVEIGIDSRERRFYRPRFRLDWPLGKTSLFAEIRYDERINGRLQGAIDYWVMAGATRRLAPGLELEGRLNHFCRHQTGLATDYVLNLNELLARLWVGAGSFRLGVGGGGYTGGTDLHRRLLSLAAEASGVLVPELSLATELRWVDGDELLADAEMALALGRGVSLFLRHSRTYGFPALTFIGLRVSAAAGFQPLADRLLLACGVYLDDDRYKIYVQGDYRLKFLEGEGRRFFLHVSFHTPILSDGRFFARFWPDRMLYDVGAEYERRLGRAARLAWYARYALDMPVDKDLPFGASLATGLALRNTADFARLDRRLRLEAHAGVSFRHDYDFGVKLGLNTRPGRRLVWGLDADGRLDGERLALEATLFAEGRGPVRLRPFLRWTRTDLRDGGHIPADCRVALGVGWSRWF